MRYLYIILLLFLFGCKKEYPTPEQVYCLDFPVRIEIQFQVYSDWINTGGTYQELRQDAERAFQFTRDSLANIEVNMYSIDDSIIIHTAPDTFSKTNSACQRLFDNDVILGYADSSDWYDYTPRSFSHMIMGNQGSKCAWFTPGYSAYCFYPPRHYGRNWLLWYMRHELTHLAGSGHSELACEDDSCHIMTTYPCYNEEYCPGIGHDYPLAEYSKYEIITDLNVFNGCWKYRSAVELPQECNLKY